MASSTDLKPWPLLARRLSILVARSGCALASTGTMVSICNDHNEYHQDVPRVVGDKGESSCVLPSLQGESTELLIVSETDLCMTIEPGQIIILVNM